MYKPFYKSDSNVYSFTRIVTPLADKYYKYSFVRTVHPVHASPGVTWEDIVIDLYKTDSTAPL